MRSMILPIHNRSRFPMAAVCLALGGCSEMINPFVDELPNSDEVTTSSVIAARAAHATPTEPARQPEPLIASAQDGTVSHWPLWFEDPFEDKGSEDGQYAWTWEDYFAFPYGFGRFLLNTMAFPVSATVTPVWTVMGSDGVLSRQALGYDHDATPHPGGVPPPADILDTGAVHPTADPVPAEGDVAPTS